MLFIFNWGEKFKFYKQDIITNHFIPKTVTRAGPGEY